MSATRAERRCASEDGTVAVSAGAAAVVARPAGERSRGSDALMMTARNEDVMVHVGEGLSGNAIEGGDWNPRTARATPLTAHTWVAGWHTGGAEALVTAVRAEAWQCIVIESTSNGPLTRSARAAVHAAGATVISPDPDKIKEAIAAVGDRCRRAMGQPQANRRPLLLMVGDGHHISNEVLDDIAHRGREGDVHLAIDARARWRTSERFDADVRCVYQGPA